MENSDVTVVLSDEFNMERLPSYSPAFQDAQDPYAFSPSPPLLRSNITTQREVPIAQKRRVKKRSCVETKKRIYPNASSIHIREPTKGIRLIKIQILDVQNSSESDSESDSKILRSAQYVVKDVCDEVMDETDRLISSISKKICGYNMYNY